MINIITMATKSLIKSQLKKTRMGKKLNNGQIMYRI